MHRNNEQIIKHSKDYHHFVAHFLEEIVDAPTNIFTVLYSNIAATRTQVFWVQVSKCTACSHMGM